VLNPILQHTLSVVDVTGNDCWLICKQLVQHLFARGGA
jgi:hypothetical protein